MRDRVTLALTLTLTHSCCIPAQWWLAAPSRTGTDTFRPHVFVPMQPPRRRSRRETGSKKMRPRPRPRRRRRRASRRSPCGARWP